MIKIRGNGKIKAIIRIFDNGWAQITPNSELTEKEEQQLAEKIASLPHSSYGYEIVASGIIMEGTEEICWLEPTLHNCKPL